MRTHSINKCVCFCLLSRATVTSEKVKYYGIWMTGSSLQRLLEAGPNQRIYYTRYDAIYRFCRDRGRARVVRDERRIADER
jgi:hypothetical protein